MEFNLKLQNTLYCCLQPKNYLRPFRWTCDKYFPTSMNVSLFCLSLLNKCIVSSALYVNFITHLWLSARKLALGKILPSMFPFFPSVSFHQCYTLMQCVILQRSMLTVNLNKNLKEVKPFVRKLLKFSLLLRQHFSFVSRKLKMFALFSIKGPYYVGLLRALQLDGNIPLNIPYAVEKSSLIFQVWYSYNAQSTCCNTLGYDTM
jgi:hypothetical protein